MSEQIELKGGTVLTPEQAKEALDEAMTIIERAGTTATDQPDFYQKAHRWMLKYYPNWA